MQFYIAQGVGLIGMILSFISFQKNDKKKILWIQASSAFTWAVHFILLGIFIDAGAFTGASMNIVEIPRNLIFAKKHKKRRQGILMAVFIAAFVTAGILTWESMFSLFPIIGMIISTVVFSLQNPRHIRFFMLPVSVLWLVYNIISFSIAGVLTESFCLCSILIAIFRFDILNSPDKNL